MTEPDAFTLGTPLTMLADNAYAYASGNNAEDAEICGHKVSSNGNLVDLSPICNSAAVGTEGQPGSSGYFGIVAADPATTSP